MYKFNNALLRILMKQKGLSAKELAIKIGNPYMTLHFWISGRSKPRLQSVKKLSDFFGIDMNDFFADENDVAYKKKLANSYFKKIVLED